MDAAIVISVLAGVVGAWFRAQDEDERKYLPFPGYDTATGIFGGLIIGSLVTPYAPETWLVAVLAFAGGYVANDLLCSGAKIGWQMRQ